MHQWAARVAKDWPAFHVESRDGWRFGLAEGVTKRANCALVLDPGADIARVTEFYSARGVKPCVQVWPGEEAVDARLAEHGYSAVEPTLVLARDLTERPAGQDSSTITARPTPEWSALFAAAGVPDRDADTVTRILAQVTAAYGVAPGGAGRGCAVLDGESVAVCAMVTAPEARGRGVARTLLADLLRWAHDKGARRAYLCVVEGNEPAVRLYGTAGFRQVCRYHNRILT